jgi:hypothetical protein
MLNKIYSHATGKKVIVIFLFYIAFTVLFQWFNAQMKSNFGSSPLDFQPSYTAEKAYSLLNSYGDSGRQFQLWIDIADLFYIFIYSLFFGLLTAFFLLKAGFSQSKLGIVVLFPFLMGLVDLFENICIFILLESYPTQLLNIAGLAGNLTQIKFTMATINLVIIFLAFLLFLWKKLLKKKV